MSACVATDQLGNVFVICTTEGSLPEFMSRKWPDVKSTLSTRIEQLLTRSVWLGTYVTHPHQQNSPIPRFPAQRLTHERPSVALTRKTI